MGQYWLTVNLDKREFIDPHKLGAGLKLWEQIASHPGTPTAITILLAAMPQARGGGDLNEHPIIGRWAGDRVALVGDYSEDADLPGSPVPFSQLYSICSMEPEEWTEYLNGLRKERPELYSRLKGVPQFTDITEQVCDVIERELDGAFMSRDEDGNHTVHRGKGWRQFVSPPPTLRTRAKSGRAAGRRAKVAA